MSEGRHNEQTWLAAIVESSEDAIIAKDLRGIVTGWNAAAERLFGYGSAEMLGRPLTVIFPAHRLDEEAMILERIARGDRVEHYETERQRKDGGVFPVSVTVSPIRDADGNLVGASNITRDLSEREAHEARVRQLQNELAHVQRLTELGQFVSALVHEVNQPLTAMTNYLNASRRLIAAGNLAGVSGAIDRIEGQARRTREIVQRIRDFVRKRDLELRAENLAQVVDETIELTRNTARGDDFQVKTEVHPSVVVHVDKVQVQQVLFNLMRNGIEAMRGLAKTRDQRGGALIARRHGGGQRRRFRAGSVRRGAKEVVPAICHDQAQWDGNGPVGLPHDHRGARWPALGRYLRA